MQSCFYTINSKSWYACLISNNTFSMLISGFRDAIIILPSVPCVSIMRMEPYVYRSEPKCLLCM